MADMEVCFDTWHVEMTRRVKLISPMNRYIEMKKMQWKIVGAFKLQF